MELQQYNSCNKEQYLLHCNGNHVYMQHVEYQGHMVNACKRSPTCTYSQTSAPVPLTWAQHQSMPSGMQAQEPVLPEQSHTPPPPAAGLRPWH
jgi:hypothetical protein